MKNSQPITIFETTVQPEWIDYNGHMNVAHYLTVFDQAMDAFNETMGIGAAYRAETQNSLFALESRLTYQREVVLGDPLRITLQLLDLDEKRLHFFERMYHAEKDTVMATVEQLVIHVNLATRHSSVMPPAVYRQLETIMHAHRKLPRPAEIDRAIGIRRRAKRGAA